MGDPAARHRLTKGSPEFREDRVDLPKAKAMSKEKKSAAEQLRYAAKARRPSTC
jgi:hypothetical protein